MITYPLERATFAIPNKDTVTSGVNDFHCVGYSERFPFFSVGSKGPIVCRQVGSLFESVSTIPVRALVCWCVEFTRHATQLVPPDKLPICPTTGWIYDGRWVLRSRSQNLFRCFCP